MTQILVVEDDAALASVFLHKLEQHSYNVLVAHGVHEAVEVLMHHNIELAVLDMNLPDGPGTAVLDYIESEPSLLGMPIIILSAYTRFIHEGRTRVSVMKILQKPITATVLFNVIEEILSS